MKAHINQTGTKIGEANKALHLELKGNKHSKYERFISVSVLITNACSLLIFNKLNLLFEQVIPASALLLSTNVSCNRGNYFF